MPCAPGGFVQNLKDMFDSFMSRNEFTDEEKAKLASLIPSQYKGVYTTLVFLDMAHPTGIAGDYATIDAGTGSDVELYIWDDNDNVWKFNSSGITPEQEAKINAAMPKAGGTWEGDTSMSFDYKMTLRGIDPDLGWDVYTTGEGMLTFKNKQNNGKDFTIDLNGVMKMDAGVIPVSDVSGVAGAVPIYNFMKLTRVQYDAIVTKNVNTQYNIVG